MLEVFAENIDSIQYTSIFTILIVIFIIKLFDLKGDRIKEYYYTCGILGYILILSFTVFVISTIARFWL